MYLGMAGVYTERNYSLSYLIKRVVPVSKTEFLNLLLVQSLFLIVLSTSCYTASRGKWRVSRSLLMARFQVLAAASMKMTDFWDMA